MCFLPLTPDMLLFCHRRFLLLSAKLLGVNLIKLFSSQMMKRSNKLRVGLIKLFWSNIRTYVDCGCKKFYNIDCWGQCYKNNTVINYCGTPNPTFSRVKIPW